jgi:hypothetical protein
VCQEEMEKRLKEVWGDEIELIWMGGGYRTDPT